MTERNLRNRIDCNWDVFNWLDPGIDGVFLFLIITCVHFRYIDQETFESQTGIEGGKE